jgi:hypothetical protein
MSTCKGSLAQIASNSASKHIIASRPLFDDSLTIRAKFGADEGSI